MAEPTYQPIITQLTQGFRAPPYQDYAEDYEWVKYAALYLLGVQVLDQLELVSLCDTTAHGPAIPVEKCYGGKVVRDHTLFSWTLKDFLDRRQQTMTWMTALEKSITPKCLEDQKNAADFKQLKVFVKLVFQCYLQHVDDSEFNLISFFTKCNACTNIERKLETGLKKNRVAQKKASYFGYALMFLWYLTHKNTVTDHNSIEQFLEINMLYTISNHYLLHFNQATIDAEEIEMTRKLDEISAEVERYKAKTATDQFCSVSVMDIYNIEVEELKHRLTAMDKDYEDKMEELEGKANYIRMYIERDRVLRQYYEDQLAFFAEDMENMRHRMSMRAKRKEEDRANEAAALEAQNKKKNKKKGKKTNSRQKKGGKTT